MGFQTSVNAARTATKAASVAVLIAVIVSATPAAYASFFESADGNQGTGGAANSSGPLYAGGSASTGTFFEASGSAGASYSTSQGTLFVPANNAFGADQATIHRLAQTREIYPYLNSLPQANQQAILQMNILNQDGSVNLNAIDQLFANGTLAGGAQASGAGGQQQFVQANNVFGADKNTVIALIDSGQIYDYLNSLPQANQQAILGLNILNQDGSVNKNRVAQLFDGGQLSGNANSGTVNNVPLNFPYSGGFFNTGAPGGTGYFNANAGSSANIASFDQCAAAGNPVMQSYPAQCRTPDGRLFVQAITGGTLYGYPGYLNQYDPYAQYGAYGAQAASMGGSLQVACRANPAQARVGQTVVWTAYVRGGSGQYSFAWSGDDGLAGTAQTTSKTYSDDGPREARVTVTSGNALMTASCGTYVSESISSCDAGANPASMSGGRFWKRW